MSSPLRLHRDGAPSRQQPVIGPNSLEPLSDPRLTAADIRVLCVMTLLAGDKFPNLEAKTERIAHDAVVTTRKVRATRARMLALGYIKIDRDESRKGHPWVTTFLFSYDPQFALSSSQPTDEKTRGRNARSSHQRNRRSSHERNARSSHSLLDWFEEKEPKRLTDGGAEVSQSCSSQDPNSSSAADLITRALKLWDNATGPKVLELIVTFGLEAVRWAMARAELRQPPPYSFGWLKTVLEEAKREEAIGKETATRPPGRPCTEAKPDEKRKPLSAADMPQGDDLEAMIRLARSPLSDGLVTANSLRHWTDVGFLAPGIVPDDILERSIRAQNELRGRLAKATPQLAGASEFRCSPIVHGLLKLTKKTDQ